MKTKHTPTNMMIHRTVSERTGFGAHELPAAAGQVMTTYLGQAVVSHVTTKNSVADDTVRMAGKGFLSGMASYLSF